ncbi:MAG: hypothetical protein NTW14_03910 [bacterium]|nr:hypothetical protein [bacterium]
MLGSEIECSNNTISLNHSIGTTSTARGGGIYVFDGAHVYGGNNILYFNEALADSECYGNVTFDYSCVAGGMAGIGNILDNPRFMDQANFDFHLLQDSPCIDSGDPSSRLDPDSTRADMGAFYFDQSSAVNGSAGASLAPLQEVWYPAGSHEIVFDGSDLPSGVYLYRLTATPTMVSGKMVLLK